MNTNQHSGPEANQEIDLRQISHQIKTLFDDFFMLIFRMFLYLKRNILWVIALLIVSFTWGYFKDRESNRYVHELIVYPNFESVDYLYDKIEQILSKKREGDTLFFKDHKLPHGFSFIKIEPVVNPFELVDPDGENFSFIRSLTDKDGPVKLLENKNITRLYQAHRITITTGSKIGYTDFVKPFLDFLNQDDYLKEIQKTAYENLERDLEANKKMIDQIDALLDEFGKEARSGSRSQSIVYYGEATQISDVLLNKQKLLKEQGKLYMNLINYKNTIQEKSVVINILDTPKFENKKIMYPVFTILGFLIFGLFRRIYRKQHQKYLALSADKAV